MIRWLKYVTFKNIIFFYYYYYYFKLCQWIVTSFHNLVFTIFELGKINNIIEGKYGKKYSKILRMIIFRWWHIRRLPSFDIFFSTIFIIETINSYILSKISQHVNI